MATVKDISGHTFVNVLAEHLRRSGQVVAPEWTGIVKTATFKELAPLDPNWYYLRSAAIARNVYLRPEIGVSKLRDTFGGAKNNGVRPSHHRKASGKIIRTILQQLEKANILEKGEEGRQVSKNGRKELDRIAFQIHSAPK